MLQDTRSLGLHSLPNSFSAQSFHRLRREINIIFNFFRIYFLSISWCCHCDRNHSNSFMSHAGEWWWGGGKMYIMISLNSVAIYCSLKNKLYLAVLVENMQEHWTEKEKYILKKLLAGLPICPSNIHQILIKYINHIYQKPSGSQNRSDSTHKFFIRTNLGDDKTLMKTTMVTISSIMKMLVTLMLMMSLMSMRLISNHEGVTELRQV